MPELGLRKVPFTAESENRLRMLKARTGLDRNYLCRMGFCLSLEEPGIPAVTPEQMKGGREIDRYTLLGQNGLAYVALALIWMKECGFDPRSAEALETCFVAHMNRGVEVLAARVKSLADLSGLLPQEMIASPSVSPDHNEAKMDKLT